MPKIKKESSVGKTSKIEEIKSDFITIASHQLRTPISAIRWSLDNVLSGKLGPLTDKQRETLQGAYQSNKFMVKVVGDLLRVADFEEKGIQLTPQFVDVAAMIKNALVNCQEFAAASNCLISFKTGDNLPKAYIDSPYLESIISSLIDNSIQYSQAKGKIKISLKKAKDYLLFEIQDNGIGIPPNQLSLVFTKFFRGSNAMKAQTEGLGLDLYLAKKIIEASGGKIEFTSQKNIKTVFSLYLPIGENQFNHSNNGLKEKPEEVLKKEREFVSITVHELKAPLGITKWSLEMLKSQKSGKLNDEQLELIDQVYRGNERLLILVRDLLNLAKLQEGKFEIESKPIKISTIISDVITGFSAEAAKKKVAIEWQNKKSSLPPVIADGNRVAQVITNLVSNAIKYTKENGKVIISVEKTTGEKIKKQTAELITASTSYTKNKNGYLVIAVADTGIGISPADQKKLFTRFFRSKKVLKSETEGTGLGLYITKSIINLHQGDIWFTSVLGQGSTFYFSLPIAKNEK
ncbi:MAG: HAMP domain-containing sensor histidine kinase [Patescibacteria group bacterium]|jgi:signal transduction histidine kinase